MLQIRPNVRAQDREIVRKVAVAGLPAGRSCDQRFVLLGFLALFSGAVGSGCGGGDSNPTSSTLDEPDAGDASGVHKNQILASPTPLLHILEKDGVAFATLAQKDTSGNPVRIHGMAIFTPDDYFIFESDTERRPYFVRTSEVALVLEDYDSDSVSMRAFVDGEWLPEQRLSVSDKVLEKVRFPDISRERLKKAAGDPAQTTFDWWAQLGGCAESLAGLKDDLAKGRVKQLDAAIALFGCGTTAAQLERVKNLVNSNQGLVSWASCVLTPLAAPWKSVLTATAWWSSCREGYKAYDRAITELSASAIAAINGYFDPSPPGQPVVTTSSPLSVGVVSQLRVDLPGALKAQQVVLHLDALAPASGGNTRQLIKGPNGWAWAGNIQPTVAGPALIYATVDGQTVLVGRVDVYAQPAFKVLVQAVPGQVSPGMATVVNAVVTGDYGPLEYHWTANGKPINAPLSATQITDTPSKDTVYGVDALDTRLFFQAVEHGETLVPVVQSDAGVPMDGGEMLGDGGAMLGDGGVAGDGGTGMGSPSLPPVAPGNEAGSLGDPHLRTFDGLRYDMQGVGEFTAVLDESDGMEVQIRTAPLGTSTGIAITAAVAVRIAGDRLGFYADGTVRLNGADTTLAMGRTVLPGGGRVYFTGSNAIVAWPDNCQLHVETFGPGIVNVRFYAADARANSLKGLFGDFNGSLTDELMTRDGVAMALHPTFKAFYGTYVESWRVTDQTSLFDYVPTENTESFTDRAFPRALATLDDLDPVARADAEKVCMTAGVPAEWLEACILDVAASGDDSFAETFVSAPEVIASLSLGEEFITFESIAGATPIDGMEISDQFRAKHGVSFTLEGGGFPVLARVGGIATAFGSNYGNDTPAPGERVGSFFLTDDGVLAGLTSPPLIVTLDTPTRAASGQILDVDLSETFAIEAIDKDGQLLEAYSIADGDSGTGDGRATTWFFNRPNADIAKLRIVGSRTSAGAFGLAFDNFNPHSAASALDVAFSVRSPDTTTLISTVGTANVGAGVEFPNIETTGQVVAADVDVDRDTIAITYPATATFGTAPFNGYAFEFSASYPPIAGAEVVGGPIDPPLTFSGNTLFVNVSGLSIGAGDTLAIRIYWSGDISGYWSGSVVQAGTMYWACLALDASTGTGQTFYSNGLVCRGDLTIQESSAAGSLYQETITGGPDACSDGLLLVSPSADTMLYNWGNGAAQGTLSRVTTCP